MYYWCEAAAEQIDGQKEKAATLDSGMGSKARRADTVRRMAS